MADPSPATVAARLQRLREAYVPMGREEAEARLAAPPRRETFEHGVARRLADLRALVALTDHLHRRVPGRGVPPG